MNQEAVKCTRKAVAFGIAMCFIAAIVPSQLLVAEDGSVSPFALNYAVAGFDAFGIGSVLNSPEDGLSAVNGLVRSWILARSNEVAAESDITGSASPSGIGQTTDLIDDGTGGIGRSWVDHGFLIDCAGFSVWDNTAPFDDELIIEVAKNSADGGYSSTCDMYLNTVDYYIGDLPTNGGLVPLHKIGGVFGSGVSGADYFNVTRTSDTQSILAWPDHPDEWGNVYGYRVFRNSSAEPWHPIFNLTFGNGTTGFADSTCVAGQTYAYSVGILYRGMQAGVQNNNTVIASLYRSYAVLSLPPATVTPTPADGSMGQNVSTAFSLRFSRTMNTAAGAASVEPSPQAGGAWAWDGTGIWYNYTGAAWNDLTKYYVNLTGFTDAGGNPLAGDTMFNFTTGDFTAPTTNVTGPLTANAWTFDVNYVYADPSGISNVVLWITGDNGTTWAPAESEAPPTGTFAGVTVPADGLYGWYTAGEDSLSNAEPSPPVGPGSAELWTLVDTVAPFIGPTTVDKLYINSQGTHGGTPPPVTVTANVSDDNLAVAGWGIRNENLVGNGTMYYRTDITYDGMPSNQTWDGKWYFINGTIVTADSAPDIFGVDVLVMGEVNGTSATGTPLGNILPEHYALFDSSTGMLQSVYRTNGTPAYLDDCPVTVGPLGRFRAYRYDEGAGYVATALNYTGPDFDFGWGWMSLTILPIVDGRYTVCVTAVDWAQNSAWTNEADGNPVITVDTVAPAVSSTVPANLDTGVALNQDIVITFSEPMYTDSVLYTITPDPGVISESWVGGTALTISHAAFSELTAYTVNITAAEDLTGNSLTAGAAPNPWTFTTGEFTAPFIVATWPSNGTVGYSTSAGTFEVLFSEPMNTGVTSVMTNLPGAAVSWNPSQSIFNITYTVLDEYTVYYVNFTGQGHTDTSGNALAGNMYFMFTTEDLTNPLAEAGSDEYRNAAFFTASASERIVPASASDSGSGIANVTWTVEAGPGTITWGSQWTLNTSVAASVAGMYILRITVTDGFGLVATDTFSLYWDLTPPVTSADTVSPYWQTSSPLALTATAADALSGMASVELWYRFSADNATWGAWTLSGNDTSAPWSWSFGFPGGNGYYEFHSRGWDRAVNCEAAPAVADAACAFDNAAPVSSVDAMSPYWQISTPLTTTATASDATDGVTSVELWHRYAPDNATWGAWANFGTDTAAPWSWSFGFPNGNGYYQFYTRAADAAGNYEAAPGAPDALCAYDSVNPTSSADAITPYWQTVSPLGIAAAANDLTDGVAAVELWYRFAADNVTWGAWANFGTDAAAPWSWSFGFPNGNGYYEFYTRAYDAAGNYEAAPGGADTACAYDNLAPASSADSIAQYWQTASPLTLTAAASDATDGVASVELWYRYAPDNATWGAWANFGTDTAAPWSWSFGFPNGNGYYQFYTRATDSAANYEAGPGTQDAACAYDSAAPVSSIDGIAPYWQTASPLGVTATASDVTDGIVAVGLWYRFAPDNATWGPWTYFGNDTAAPWSWSFGFALNGHYEFYARAVDAAGNYEAAPALADARCGYDSVLPSSAADGIAPYWQTSSPMTVTAAASDLLSGSAAVELWFRFSADNATWGAWTLYGTDNAAPWSWSFGFPNGNGYYEFYTRAYDAAGNYEAAPLGADALCGYDNIFPTSFANATAPYWLSVSPLTVTATAIQATADIEAVELWYRYSADNATWGAWTLFGNDTAAPWSWDFAFGADGYYEFYTRAIDLAAKYEAAPPGADALCGYDTIVPTSSANAISPYWRAVSPLTVTVTASDGLSGIAMAELFYRYAADNLSWGSWVSYGTDVIAPYSFSFSFPNGQGYYEFFSNATDSAGNEGIALPTAQALCALDTTQPTSSVDAIASYWQTTSPLTVTATASDALSGLVDVGLFYQWSPDNLSWAGWTLFGNDNAAPWSWSFNFPDGNGYYQFYSLASDVLWSEAAPAGMDALCAYDNTAPTSGADAPAQYWQTASPLTLTAAASDATDGVASVELWYRFSANNATWGPWTIVGTDAAAPWSWSFGFPNGNGYYQFYTRAADAAGNYEAAPGAGDAVCAYDNAAPSSGVSALSPYWRISSPLTVAATAADLTGIVASVELWYRFASDNATWGAWTIFGTDNAAPWSWSFGFPNGNGYYQLYARARDAAGNYEAAPFGADTLCAFDSGAPASAADAAAQYWQTASLTVTATGSDALSGVGSVALWYRFSGDNATWGAWANFGTDTAAPWSWSFGFPDGNGYYQFYTVALDRAGNAEAAPGTYDTLCGWDGSLPASAVNNVSPYWSTASPLTVTATASDVISGLASAELWYRYSADNATWDPWTLFGTDTAAPWSWSFGFPNGNGYYEFYTRAYDAAGNYEAAPGTRDAAAGFDDIAPETAATVPADLDTGVTFNQAISITFTEAMDPVSVIVTVTPNPGGLAYAWGSGNTVLTITHNPFTGGTTYVVQVTDGADPAGNALAPGTAPNPWSFTAMAALTVDYIRIETDATSGIPAGARSMTADQTYTVWAIGYNNLYGRIGPVPLPGASWSTAGGLDPQANNGQSFAFSPMHAPSQGIIIASYGMLTAVTGLVTVSPGAVARFNITGAPAAITADDTAQFQTAGYDQEWNPTGPVPVAWSMTHATMAPSTVNGTISASGLFMPGLIGTWTVTAYNGTFSAGNATRTATITVTVGALASVAVTPTYIRVNAGESTAFTAAGRDSKGNTVVLAGSPTWFLGGTVQASGTLSSTVAGNHTVFASHSGFLGIAYLDVTAGAGNRLVISQAANVISADQTCMFTATARDAYGNSISGPLPTIVWAASNGTIPGGLFTPWAAGQIRVWANATGYAGGIAFLNVTAGTVTRIVIGTGSSGTRAIADIAAGGSRLFTVSALDQRNNLVAVPVSLLTWATTLGTVSNGFFTALTNLNGAQSVSGTVSVTYASGATQIVGAETFNVTVGPLHHITVGPAASVSLNEYHTYTAQGFDMYGNAITGLTFVWGTTGNVGTVDNGVFHGTDPGMGTVTATSGTVTGDLPVFVSAPEGIFASWLWLVIILFIVVIILVVLLILGRRREIVVLKEPDEPVDEDELPEHEDLEAADVPEEFHEPLADLEHELDEMAAQPAPAPPETAREGPEITPAEVKNQIAEAMRVERCEKMLSASVVLPDDKEKLQAMIAGGISPDRFVDEIHRAVERRKKKEQEKDVTADEKAAILEDELVAELAELEGNLDDGAKEEDLEDEILKEIEDLEDM